MESSLKPGKCPLKTVTKISAFNFRDSDLRSSQRECNSYFLFLKTQEGLTINPDPPSVRWRIDPHLCVTHALRLRHLVGEVRLLESRGAHSLVHGRVGAWRRVRRIQARLDQGLACFARDHGLEFAGRKSVHVARFTGHQQQDLGSCQGGQLVRLSGEDSTVSKDFNHLERSGSPNWGLDYLHIKDKTTGNLIGFQR